MEKFDAFSMCFAKGAKDVMCSSISGSSCCRAWQTARKTFAWPNSVFVARRSFVIVAASTEQEVCVCSSETGS